MGFKLLKPVRALDELKKTTLVSDELLLSKLSHMASVIDSISKNVADISIDTNLINDGQTAMLTLLEATGSKLNPLYVIALGPTHSDQPFVEE